MLKMKKIEDLLTRPRIIDFLVNICELLGLTITLNESFG